MIFTVSGCWCSDGAVLQVRRFHSVLDTDFSEKQVLHLLAASRNPGLGQHPSGQSIIWHLSLPVNLQFACCLSDWKWVIQCSACSSLSLLVMMKLVCLFKAGAWAGFPSNQSPHSTGILNHHHHHYHHPEGS